MSSPASVAAERAQPRCATSSAVLAPTVAVIAAVSAARVEPRRGLLDMVAEAFEQPRRRRASRRRPADRPAPRSSARASARRAAGRGRARPRSGTAAPASARRSGCRARRHGSRRARAAQSRTERVTTWLTVSPNQPSVAFGPTGTRPRDGFSPNSPHAAAGQRIDPPPSDACATGTTPRRDRRRRAAARPAGAAGAVPRVARQAVGAAFGRHRQAELGRRRLGEGVEPGGVEPREQRRIVLGDVAVEQPAALARPLAGDVHVEVLDDERHPGERAGERLRRRAPRPVEQRLGDEVEVGRPAPPPRSPRRAVRPGVTSPRARPARRGRSRRGRHSRRRSCRVPKLRLVAVEPAAEVGDQVGGVLEADATAGRSGCPPKRSADASPCGCRRARPAGSGFRTRPTKSRCRNASRLSISAAVCAPRRRA